MRSRTSSSKAVILKKDLTRFAPVWVEYGVVLAIIAILAFLFKDKLLQCYAFGKSTDTKTLQLGRKGYSLQSIATCKPILRYRSKGIRQIYLHQAIAFMKGIETNTADRAEINIFQ